ncbi:MAG: tetratricopeptide repeat protein, partial [Verrucomicrobiota bacterium]
ALGKAALLLGAEPKLVLDNLFERAKKIDPEYRGSYLAIGDLALEKHDYALAAKTYEEGLKRFPEDSDFHYGLARSFAPSDAKQMGAALEEALEHNPNHAPSLLLLADHLIDGEEYDSAEENLAKVFEINPAHPEAWAYRAVIAHIRNEAAAEIDARSNALKHWSRNPEVDHLIGKKLSQKYRFAEGELYQRRALIFDPSYLAARIQLAQDLLRLGKEEEGWKLADEVNREDGYDVAAYNLVTLHSTLNKYQTLTNEHFIVRMTTQEAALYGERVLALLERAKTNLCDKYGIELKEPTIIEIFANQKDFGVRTFGMPHNPGFLGVCFGRVVTANSPATQVGHSSNWEAVLWHEFCHVVTLQMTRNKMPRWLSEGISVYEERQAHSSWGQKMTPRYRERILEGGLVPVKELSAAFLKARDDADMQFAYYQSSLVVEYLMGRFGLEAVKKILQDLADGTPINDAIARHTLEMDKIEKEFAEFARDEARKLGPALDWKKPSPDHLAQKQWVEKNPTNYYALLFQARQLASDKKWEEARVLAEKLVEQLEGESTDPSAYTLLATIYRELKMTDRERDVLRKLAKMESDTTEAYLRLMELAAAENQWDEVAENAERFLAVNPLVPAPYRHLAIAEEKRGNMTGAISANEKLLKLDPADPAEIHYRLANLLQKSDVPAAKRHVLQALEEAPRFRKAHELLLGLRAATVAEPEPSPQPSVKPEPAKP